MEVFNYELLIYKSDEPENPRRLSGVNAAYSLQQIPSAVVYAPAGRPIAGDGSRVRSEDREIPDEWMEPTTLLTVAFRRIRRAKSLFSSAKSETIILFEGYPTIASSSMTKRSAEGVLTLTHWLRDLAASTAFHMYAYSPMTADMGVPILYREPAAAVGVGGNPATHNVAGFVTRLGLPFDYVTRIQEDAWAFGFKSLIATLATYPLQKRFERVVECGDLINTVNPRAAEAISRIEGPSPLLSRPYLDGVPLQIRTDYNGVQIPELVSAIRKVVLDFSDVKGGGTFWARLLRFASDMMLDVIPRPTDALVVPMVPIPDQLFETEIEPEEVLSINWAETDDMRLRGTILVGTAALDTIVMDATLQSRMGEIPLGCYVADADPAQGVIAPIRAPQWLERLASHYASFGFVNAFRVGRSHSESTNSQFVDPTDKPNADSQNTVIFNEYAKMRWVEEELKNNRATVVTYLRTDIAPGSFIRVNLGDAAKYQPFGDVGEWIVGKVMSVSHRLDRSGRNAETQFSLGFVLTQSMYESGKFSQSQHPIFTEVFTGSALSTPIEEQTITGPSDADQQ